MTYFIFSIGVFLGSILALTITYYKSGYGFFDTQKEPDSDDPRDLVLNITIPHGQKLSKKSRIILIRKKLSQK